MLAAALLTGLAASPHYATAATVAMPMPGASLHQLDTVLTDGAGKHFTLRDMAGTPVLVTMFYGDCHAACPIIIENLKRTVAALGTDAGPLRVLLISLDPGHDTPDSLAMLARKNGLDPARFRLAVAADDSATRTLASTLDIKFRRLDNGEINHTTRVALLDAAGSTRATSSRLDVTPDTTFVTQIAALLKSVKTGSDQGIAK
jgi:protein SCO1/2